MRISDWSSDVCSSDLQANRDFPDIVKQYGQVQTISGSLAPARTVLLEQLREQYPQHAVRFTEASFNAGQIDLNQYELRNDQDLQRRPRRQQEPNQIGRASCRERVCQYG